MINFKTSNALDTDFKKETLINEQFEELMENLDKQREREMTELRSRMSS